MVTIRRITISIKIALRVKRISSTAVLFSESSLETSAIGIIWFPVESTTGIISSSFSDSSYSSCALLISSDFNSSVVFLRWSV